MLGQEQRTGSSLTGGLDLKELVERMRLQTRPWMTEVRSGWGQSVPGHTEFTEFVLSAVKDFEIHQPVIIAVQPVDQRIGQGLEPYLHGGEAAIPGRLNDRRDEMDWVSAHLNTLRRFANMWVVIERDRIVSSDTDPSEAVERARRVGVIRPFLLFVQFQDDAIAF